ncbi:MAG: O-antigen ligase family protein [bacterium]
MYPILLLVIIISYAVLAWRDLKLALAVLAGLLPIYLLRFSVGPIPTTALEVLVLISLAIWLIKYRGFKVNTKNLNPWLKPALLLIGAASISAAIAPDLFDALGIWKAYFIEPVLVFVMLKSLFDANDWRRLLIALAVSTIALSVIAIAQAITGFGIPAPWDAELRVTSVFDYPNALGLFVAPIVAATIMMFVRERKPLWAIAAIFGAIAIALSETEAALVAVPAALVITLLFTKASKKTKIRVVIELALVVLILIVAIPTVRQKLLLQDFSGQTRIAQWTETTAMMTDRVGYLLLGVGLNGYPAALEPYHNSSFYEIFQYPHNIVLNFWAETGLIGMVAIIWLGVLTIKAIRPSKSLNLSQPLSTSLKLAAFAALATMLIHGLVDVPYFKNDLAILTWMMIGIIASKHREVIAKS